MRIDLPGIEAFLGVANWGSFRRAAGHLNLSQAALSHRIKKLEESLGTPLLARTTRRVSLTRAGEELLPTAQRLVQDMAATLDALRGRRDAGPERLAIGCLPTAAVLHLPPVLAEFARRRPDVQVQVYDVSAADIADRVRAGDAEFGVTILSAKSWDLEIVPVVSDPFVVVCGTGHRFAALDAVSWTDLADEPLIRISTEAWNRQLIDQALGPRRESLRWRVEVQHVATAIAMVREGLGLGVIPRSGLRAELGPGRSSARASVGSNEPVRAGNALVGVPLARPALSRTLGFVTRRDAVPTAHAALLMSLVAARLKAG